MISKIEKSTLKAICNGCGVEYVYEGKYTDLSLILKDSEWISLKQSGEWKHYCPDCKNHSWNWGD